MCQYPNCDCAVGFPEGHRPSPNTECPLDLVGQAFECCKQVVRSYGPRDLTERQRSALIECMGVYQRAAERSAQQES